MLIFILYELLLCHSNIVKLASSAILIFLMENHLYADVNFYLTSILLCHSNLSKLHHLQGDLLSGKKIDVKRFLR